MNLDFGETTSALRSMVSDFFYVLPFFVLGIIVYFILHFAARYVSRAITYAVARRARHCNLATVLERLAQGGIMLMGLLTRSVGSPRPCAGAGLTVCRNKNDRDAEEVRQERLEVRPTPAVLRLGRASRPAQDEGQGFSNSLQIG